VTSRIQLDLKTERLLELDGLPYPEDETPVFQPEQYAAIRLFEQRAQVIALNFSLSDENLPSVTRICQIVHGIPLGIELAAAWIRFLPITELLQQIEQNLDMLATTMRDVPERQRSLTAVFDYVWSLLGEDDRRVFAQLSIFRGSFDLEAFQVITTGSLWTMAALVEKSLLHKEVDGRYRLVEALHLYATTKLVELADAVTQTETLHSHCYADLLHKQKLQLTSSTAQKALNIIQQNLDNIHIAWTYAATSCRWADVALAQEGLALYYLHRGPYQEGELLLKTAVDRLTSHHQDSPDNITVLTKLYNNYARLAEVVGNYPTAIRQAQTAISLAQTLGQQELEAAANIVWGTILLHQADYSVANERLNIACALAEAAGAKQAMASALNRLGQTAHYQSFYKESQQYQEQSLTLHKELGNQQGVSKNLINLGRGAYVQGSYAEAKRYYSQALPIEEESGHLRGVAHIFTNLGLIADAQSKYEDAHQYHDQALTIQEEINDRQGIANSFNNIGLIASHQSDYVKARHFHERALHIFEELGTRHSIALTLNNLGVVAYAIETETDSENYHEARYYYEQALSIQEEIGDRRSAALSILNLGRITESRGEFTEMQRYSNQALKIFKEIGDRRGAILCLNNLGFAAYNQGMYADANHYYEQVLVDAEEMGDQLMTVYSFLNLANVFFCRGAYGDARQYHERALVSAEKVKDLNQTVSYALTGLAMVLIGLKEFELSLSKAKRAISLRQELGQEKLVMESQAVLAEAWLAQNDLAAARKAIEPIATYLDEGGNFEGTEYRLRNRLICFRVLQAGEDSRAKKIIQTAYKRLQTEAKQIQDPEINQAFLDNVPWHKEIIIAYEQIVPIPQ